jgi:hypothetical protein
MALCHRAKRDAEPLFSLLFAAFYQADQEATVRAKVPVPLFKDHVGRS